MSKDRPITDVSPSSPSASVRDLSWSAILLLAIVQFAAFVDRGVPAVVAPLLRTGFGLTDTQVGALQGPAFSVLYALELLAAGQWIAGRNPYRTAGACLVVWTAGSVLFALAPGYGGMIAGRAILGLGQAAFAPAALSLLAVQADPVRRARALSIFTTGSSIGRSAALFLGGAALTLVAGRTVLGLEPWRMTSLMMVVPNLLLAVVLFGVARGSNPPIPVRTGLGAAAKFIAARPSTLLLVMAVGSACVLAVQAGGAWGSSILHRSQGLTPAQAGLWTGALVLVCAPIGHLGAGWTAGSRAGRRWGAGVLMAAGMAVAVLGAVGLAAAEGRAAALAGLGVLTAGGGFAAAATLIEVLAMTETRLRSQVSAIYLALVSLVGVGLGSVLTGMVNDRAFSGAGLAWSLASVVAISALPVIVIGLLYARHWREAAYRPATD